MSESVIFSFLERAVEVALSNSTLNSSNSSPRDSELGYFAEEDKEEVKAEEEVRTRFSLSSSIGEEGIAERESEPRELSSLITLFLGIDLGTLEVEIGIVESAEVVEEEIEEREDKVEMEDVEVVRRASFETTLLVVAEREGWESKVEVEDFLVEVEEAAVDLREWID